MFSKILIANRGEIACRIMRTAKRMGIGTVAVYSEADRDALHVRMADEAVCIGPAPSSESYLNIEAIVDAVRSTGAEAVHPGFGFVSENAGFVTALEQAGIEFIGPKPRAIGAMGDKIESKKLAEQAGVSVVPGHPEAIDDVEEAIAIARQLGYPVMLKASAGGGGKGMRIAHDDQGVREGLVSAMNEAASAFADDRVFVEKFIEQPRHIEIQVLADRHGNVIHLGERECSIQRRHQKVIEEAPSPFLDPETRAAMGAQAVALARAVDYESAGTVEFIVDRQRQFYFLEMNTRLQVEHPVTECVTGLDLVEQMIRVASGEPLPLDQDSVQMNGWALEARVYAEDPERGFLPATGRLVRYVAPAESGTVRIDSGVEEGSEISVYYDPMIAKLVTSGDTRAAATAAMRDALDGYAVEGLATNLAFLSAIVLHEAFVAGDLTTQFIDEYFADGFDASSHGHEDEGRLIAIAAFAHWHRQTRNQSLGQAAPIPVVRTELAAIVGNAREHSVRIEILPTSGGVEVIVDQHTYRVEGANPLGSLRFEGTVNGERYFARLERERVGWAVTQRGARRLVSFYTPRAVELMGMMPVKSPPDLSRYLLSPMPGLLLRVSVAPGEAVKAGQELAVVEAMKMENVLFAGQDGVVESVHAAVGDSLAVDQPIVEFAED